MNLAVVRRRAAMRSVALDRSLEPLPLFRLSDSADDAQVAYTTDDGGRWRVLPAPGDRLPGTFDQDVYVELCRRFHDAEHPRDGIISFTLHSFLRSIGRRVDGRTYDQLRSALTRLERTTLESTNAYYAASIRAPVTGQFTVLSSVSIERRRIIDREQLALFSAVPAAEPGVARVVLHPLVRENILARHVVTLSLPRYLALQSPVARRLYRLLEIARANGMLSWRVPLERLREMLPLVQKYPSHLQRVLQPAHVMLMEAGLVRDALFKQHRREWHAEYVLASRAE
ncbi:MAG TPA: replication initiator protein A [Gemmatimonadaceae bacterium]|nr:replication initiator protein A [Gemmatimonadaceae bacterium]